MTVVNKTKEKILKAAQKLFSENDFDQVSIKQVCELANVSNGSFYHQIGSKENLIRELYLSICEKAITKLVKIIKGKNSIEKILALVEVHVEYTLLYKYKFSKQLFLLSLRSENPESEPNILYDFLEQYIAEAFQEGLFSEDYNKEHILMTLISVMNGFSYEWCVTDGKLDLKEKVFSAITFLIEKYKV